MDVSIRRISAATRRGIIHARAARPMRAVRAAVFVAARAAMLVVAAAGAGASARAAGSGDSPSVVPYRPSVSTPATLSAPGWLEVEGGVQREHEGAGGRRDSIPATLKLAFSPDWGVVVSGDAWVRQRDDAGGRTSGFGDAAVIVKRRFGIDDESAFGLEAGTLLPTSRRGLGEGSGKPDWGTRAIYSADFGAWHSDLNVAATRVGAAASGTGRVQLLGAAALSRSLDPHWSAAAELSATQRSGAENTRQLLAAASYAVSRSLVLDVGAARSLRGGDRTWSAFTGFTWLAGQVF